MTQSLIMWQFLFSCSMGVLAYWLARLVGQRVRRAGLESIKKRMEAWPSVFHRIWLYVAIFIPIAERWSRPSSRLSKALEVAGGNPRLTDREFVVFRGAVSLCLTVTAFVILLFGGYFFEFSPIIILGGAMLPGLLAYLLITARVFDQYQRIQRQVSRSFPSFLDVLSLTLESGKNFQSALQLSVEQLPSEGAGAGLRTQLEELVRDIRASGSRTSALQRFSERLSIAEIVQFTAAVIAAERQGVSVSALLRRQAEQLRTSQALAAERHAMKLPVKLLAPLAICIFPCTFLILAFPLTVRLSGSGLF